jgi:hypothetical protein
MARTDLGPLSFLLPRRIIQRHELGLLLGDQAKDGLPRRFVLLCRQLPAIVIDVKSSHDNPLVHGAALREFGRGYSATRPLEKSSTDLRRNFTVQPLI